MIKRVQQKKNKDSTQSLSYFPVVFRNENEMSKVRAALLEKDIAARQYFKPSLDTLPYVEDRGVMQNSRDIASRIIVIPMHSGVEPTVSEIIIDTLKSIRSESNDNNIVMPTDILSKTS